MNTHFVTTLDARIGSVDVWWSERTDTYTAVCGHCDDEVTAHPEDHAWLLEQTKTHRCNPFLVLLYGDETAGPVLSVLAA